MSAEQCVQEATPGMFCEVTWGQTYERCVKPGLSFKTHHTVSLFGDVARITVTVICRNF